MPNFQSFINRKRSIQSTRKITTAMQIVSAARLKKINATLKQLEMPLMHLKKWVGCFLSDIQEVDPWPFLLGPMMEQNTDNEEGPIHLFIVIGSDQGLCGNFNHGLEKMFHEIILNGPEERVRLMCLGQKLQILLEKKYKSLFWGPVLKIIPGDYKAAKMLGDFLIQSLESEKFHKCTLIYTYSRSALSQEVVVRSFLPLSIVDMKRESAGLQGGEIDSTACFLYEPSVGDLLSILLPSLVNMQLYQALLYSASSEFSVRMLSMENSSRNADNLIKGLERMCNKMRQSHITKELIEIIAGAESL